MESCFLGMDISLPMLPIEIKTTSLRIIDENTIPCISLIADMVKYKGVKAVEEFMLTLPQEDCPVIHHYAPNQYIREVCLAAGSLVVGQYQTTEHLNIMLTGSVTMIADSGNTVEVVAPRMFVGKAGRKLGFIHETTNWLNIYNTSEQDVDVLEAMFLDKSKEAEVIITARRMNKDVSQDREDYIAVLSQFNFTEEQARAMSDYTGDNIQLPYGAYKIKLASSPIQGRGLFATAPIIAGEYIAYARLDGKRTIAGRFTNHSKTPNAEFQLHGEDLILVASMGIGGCLGGFDGEEITIDYRIPIQMIFSELEGV